MRKSRFFMPAGRVSDDTGAAALPGSLPAAEWLVAEGIDSVSLNPDTVVDTWIRLAGVAEASAGPDAVAAAGVAAGN